jgi:hypothetical protein
MSDKSFQNPQKTVFYSPEPSEKPVEIERALSMRIQRMKDKSEKLDSAREQRRADPVVFIQSRNNSNH